MIGEGLAIGTLRAEQARDHLPLAHELAFLDQNGRDHGIVRHGHARDAACRLQKAGRCNGAAVGAKGEEKEGRDHQREKQPANCLPAQGRNEKNIAVKAMTMIQRLLSKELHPAPPRLTLLGQGANIREIYGPRQTKIRADGRC